MRMIKPGLRLKSAVCSTEIMVLRSPAAEAVLCCGGAEMIAAADAPASGARLDPAHAQGSLIGKRYVDEADALEILCTRGGEGSLTFNGIPLSVKQAKALPSSD
ncbi:MAG TPA: hypothetical protein VEH54_03510 [Steroidobacteraceae bacterium]|nr:hypothetical protein [Steroidobacteraceae bacterium]